MPWAQLDDQFHSHRKFLSAGLEATGLYARALSYCAASLTDGFVPGSWINLHVGPKRGLPKRLVDVEAWDPICRGDTVELETRAGDTVQVTATEDGYVIPDYLLYNPSKAEHDARQKQRRAAGSKGARSRWGDSETDGDSDGDRHGTRHSDRHGESHRPPRASARAGVARPRPAPPHKSSGPESVPSASAAAAADIATILQQIQKPGYASGKVTPRRVEAVIDAYPGRDNRREALQLVDWETHGAGADEPTKDGIARFRKWLAKAPPREEVKPDGTNEVDLSAYVKA